MKTPGGLWWPALFCLGLGILMLGVTVGAAPLLATNDDSTPVGMQTTPDPVVSAPAAKGWVAFLPGGGGTPPVADGNAGTEGVLPSSLAGLGLRSLLVLALLLLAGRLVLFSRPVNQIDKPGFEVISPTESRTFIPLEERFQALDFLQQMETKGGLRLSANLNKVTLAERRYGYMMEDKNFRNALLVNRRRVRRTLLRNGDVLDLGDLTLLYRDNREGQITRHASITPPEGKVQIKFDRARGPVRKGMPMLVSDQVPNRTFYLSKNLIYIGRSETCDLVIKSHPVYLRHAKIIRVGGRYKLQDLSLLGNTFVNNRRVEQRFLRPGDEISIENHKFRFQLANKNLRDQPSGGKGDASNGDRQEADDMEGGQYAKG